MNAHPFISFHGPASPRSWRSMGLSGLALAVFTLSGCASVFLVDNQVESFARWTEPSALASVPVTVPQPPQTYRFERLPSQGQQGQSPRASSQDQIEALAQDALARHGWTPAGPGVYPPWVVEVASATLRLPRAPWESPWYGWGGGFWGGGLAHSPYVWPGGHVVWSPMFMHMETPYYQREVSLVIRHAATGRVVYETRAAHDGRWNSTPALWSAMLGAALQGFPNPPGGTRQVNIEVPR